MRTIIFACLISLFAGITPILSQNRLPDDIEVMSFNMRYDNASDSLNPWSKRCPLIADFINFEAPDIIGTQELLQHQLTNLKALLPDYQAIGRPRDDGETKGEYSALLYNRHRFEAVDTGTFWLSETPDIVGSKGWDGACRRIATWARLRDLRNGKEIFIINTHLDHIGRMARSGGIALVVSKALQLGANAPKILTGDLNSGPDSDVAKHVGNTFVDARRHAAYVYGTDWTFHDYGREPLDTRERIDFVCATPDLSPVAYAVITDMPGGKYMSDHSPVIVRYRYTR